MNKLKDSYKTNNQNELLAHYDDWDTYEEDMAKSGYLGPIGCGALLNKYIDELEIDLDKDRLKGMMRGLYNEAQDLEI